MIMASPAFPKRRNDGTFEILISIEVSSKIPNLKGWVTEWVRTASPWNRTWSSGFSERTEVLAWNDAYETGPTIETNTDELVELKVRGRAAAPFWKDWMVRFVDELCRAHPGSKLTSFESV